MAALPARVPGAQVSRRFLARAGLSAFLRTGLEEDLYDERTVARLARMLCAGNAERVYFLGDRM
jgi:hypothetical protein